MALISRIQLGARTSVINERIMLLRHVSLLLRHVSLLLALALFTEQANGAGTSCNCGVVNKGRIVGGKDTKKNQYPFMVAILSEEKGQFCGGTIVTPWHVLTAAHCTHEYKPRDLQLNLGAHNLQENSSGVYQVAKIIQHEKYNHEGLKYDIALLVTKKQIKFDHNVSPACLPTESLNLTGKKVKGIGWGNTYNKGTPSITLKEVDLTVSDFKKCKKAWLGDILEPLAGTNMCTFSRGKDTCQGDSGGPLIWLDPEINRYTLAALVSFGGPCGGDLPSGNTDVSAFLPWIQRHIEATKPGVKTCQKL